MPQSESTTEKAPANLITVVSKRGGFRRGGRPWPASPTTVDTKEFTPEQLADIRAEKMLVITEGGATQTDKTASLDRSVELEQMVTERVAEVQKNADARVGEVEGQLKTTQGELADVKADLEIASKSLAPTQAEVATLTSQLNAEKGAHSKVSGELSVAQARITELEKTAKKGKAANN